MAEADAEASFLRSMQAMNENSEIYTNGDASGQQIDSSSSDEYDPAPDVQNVTVPSGPQLQSQSVQDTSVDSSNNAFSRPLLASLQPSSNTNVQAVPETASPANDIPLVSNTNGNIGHPSRLQPNPEDPPNATVPSAPNAGNAESATTSDIVAAAREDSNVGQEVIVGDEAPVEATSTAAPPKTRLPHDRVGILEDRIKEDERGDMDAWLGLIAEHRKRGKIEEARKTFEKFFTVFPDAAEQWVAYTQLENEANNRAAVEMIFNKTLTQIPSLPLWSAYLDHIRRHYNIAADKTAGQVIHAAYLAVVDAVGIDKDAGRLWQEYIQFIKSGPGVLGGNAWQDQQKMDLLRKTYQRAICIPTQVVESLWREYNSFEMSLNKQTGRKFLQDMGPTYMTARSSYTELQNITRDLKRTTLPSLPPAAGFDGDIEYMKQVEIWGRWIQWEKDDPLVLKQDNLSAYNARIVFVHKQALMALRFWPEMWYDAAEFCFNNDLESQGNSILTQGILANPESCLLAFKHADRLELSSTSESDDESKKRRGDMVREPYDKVLKALYGLAEKAKERETRDIARIEAHFAAMSPDVDKDLRKPSDDEPDEDDKPASNPEKQQKQTQIDIVKTMSNVQIDLLNKTITHAWIALMRAMRRVQGKGKVNSLVGGSRQVFVDARKRGRILGDLWIEAAMLEYHSDERDSEKRIFERGVKLFLNDGRFALEYLKHLVATNDHNHAPVIFEQSVGKLLQSEETKAKAKPLFAVFHSFLTRNGELSQIAKLEERMREAFLEDPRLSFSKRFTDEGFDPTTVRVLISPTTQTRPKSMPTIEPVPSAPNSPPNRYAQVTNSPKRPLDESDSDAVHPRKVARGESPLKGAAGRRLDKQRRNLQSQGMPQFEGQSTTHPILPPPLPRGIGFLLSIIPKASTYHATKFSPEAMVRLIRDTNIASPASHGRPEAMPNGGGPPPIPPSQYINGHYPYNRPL